MALPERMKFGIFLGPFHRVGENPTLAIDRDMELVQWLDYLGYDEAWIGEHHSAGWETISSPEIFMAVAADRTKHIKLGTGVISLPYHHPFMVANRMVQLDHMTHGRVMLGVGPGALPGDAYMLGIDAANVFKRVVAWGDGWMPVRADVERVKQGRATMDELAEAAGRDPRSIQLSVYAAPHDRDEIAQYEEAGANRAIVNLPSTLEGEGLAGLEQLAKEVLS